MENIETINLGDGEYAVIKLTNIGKIEKAFLIPKLKGLTGISLCEKIINFIKDDKKDKSITDIIELCLSYVYISGEVDKLNKKEKIKFTHENGEIYDNINLEDKDIMYLFANFIIYNYSFFFDGDLISMKQLGYLDLRMVVETMMTKMLTKSLEKAIETIED